MKIKRLSSILISWFVFSGVCVAQTIKKTEPAPTGAVKAVASGVKSSAAFAEILLRKTERSAQLEEFLIDYTEEFPKIKELRFELELLQKQIEKVLAVGAAEVPKLSPALGKLMVRKTELEVDLWNLLKQYNADHPEVKRAKRKVEVYEKAVKEILP